MKINKGVGSTETRNNSSFGRSDTVGETSTLQRKSAG